MKEMKKNILLIFMVGVLLLFTGCDSTSSGTQKSSGVEISSFNGGNEALVFEFVEGMPPEAVRDQGLQPFSIRMIVENKGEYDIGENEAHVVLSGFNMDDFDVIDKSQDLMALRGVKKQGSNTIPGGKSATIFSNLKYKESVVSGSVPLTLFANICYPYETKSVAKVCLAGDTSIAIDKRQINCELDGSKDFANSGGPIKIENVEQYPYGRNSIQIQFDIVHSETSSYANVYERGSIDSECNINGSLPSSSDALFKKDRISYIVDTGIEGLSCEGTGTNTNVITLSNNRYTVTCVQDTLGQGESYEKPILITLSYDYFDRVSKKINIEHVQR